MTIAINAVRQRHLRPDQMEHRTFYEGHIAIDLANLCDEVEHLRAEHAARLAALLDAERENTALRAEVAYLREERAAVVAFLREQANQWDREAAGWAALNHASVMIEAGLHRPGRA